jgi:hypothetical protein
LCHILSDRVVDFSSACIADNLALLGCKTDFEGLMVLPTLCAIVDMQCFQSLEEWSLVMAERAVQIADLAPALVDR